MTFVIPSKARNSTTSPVSPDPSLGIALEADECGPAYA